MNVPSIPFVCLMGMGIVFIGLVCIIVLIEIMSRILGGTKPAPAADTSVQSAPVAAPPQTPTTPVAVINRGEVIAAVCAAVAEELGVGVEALRVVSFRQVTPGTPVAACPGNEDRGAVVAAVCAAVAEELGTDVDALRVVSFKKL